MRAATKSSLILKQHRRRGFTYVEMGVVLVVIAMFSALVTPHLLKTRKSQELRLLAPRLDALVLLGRSRAAASRIVVTLSYNGSDKTFRIDGNAENQSSNASKATTVQLPESVTIARQTLKGADVGEDDWSVKFQPDGTSEGASVEFDEGKRTFSWIIGETRADDIVREGEVGEKPETKWEAGEIERRA